LPRPATTNSGHRSTTGPPRRRRPATFRDRFLREARERFGDLPPEDLARRAEHLRKAYYARLALKSAQARQQDTKAGT
jgi:hypothetical protein